MPSERPGARAEGHLLGFLGDVGGVSAREKSDFLRAVAVAPPPDVRVLYWQARVTLLRRVEDLEDFDRLFHAWFTDEPTPPVELPDVDEADDEQEAPDHSGGDVDAREFGEGTGVEASRDDLASRAQFAATTVDRRHVLADLRAAWPDALPRVRARRSRPARRGSRLDGRRTARLANRTGGEIVELAWRQRRCGPAGCWC